MTGEELFGLWREANAGYEDIGPWAGLDPRGKASWDRLAERLDARG